jgi:hypothetical protein
MYATTNSSTTLLTVETVNIIIVNTAGYIALDIVVSVVPFIVVLLALVQNVSPVDQVERMEPLIPIPRIVRWSTFIVMRILVMAASIPGVILISLMT